MTELVDAAYRHYVPRIGGLPGPMTADYRHVIAERAVTVAVADGSVADESVAGLIVLAETPEGLCIENVAVHPNHQGRGLGRALLAFAEREAGHAGFGSIYLYTHEKMTENLALYGRLGYVQYDRRPMTGFSLVFLRKQL
ncbi:MAG TPA: GNAT family N-acetyltransferase [Actinoplanes sp.]|nr:GNAT family N-acetyltransferase [Actinoplanes sp.]